MPEREVPVSDSAFAGTGAALVVEAVGDWGSARGMEETTRSWESGREGV